MGVGWGGDGWWAGVRGVQGGGGWAEGSSAECRGAWTSPTGCRAPAPPARHRPPPKTPARLAAEGDAQCVSVLRHDGLRHVGGRRRRRHARLFAGARGAGGAVGQQRQRRRQRGAALPGGATAAAGAGIVSLRLHGLPCRSAPGTQPLSRNPPVPMCYRPQPRLLHLLRLPGVRPQRAPPREAPLAAVLGGLVDRLLLGADGHDAGQGLAGTGQGEEGGRGKGSQAAAARGRARRGKGRSAPACGPRRPRTRASARAPPAGCCCCLSLSPPPPPPPGLRLRRDTNVRYALQQW
jgi:hypothetical protein